jgi:predicted DNA-binding transcriptional regulator YafY
LSRLTSTTRQVQILTLLERKPATFAEIDSYLSKYAVAHDMDILFSERTLQRDVKDIAILFNTEIKFDRKMKLYTISKDEDYEVKNKLLYNAYQHLSLLSLSDNFKEFIEFDNSPDTGTEHFQFIINAIKDTYQIKIVYQKFNTTETKVYNCEPYLLKQNQSRWYLIAKVVESNNEHIKIYGLDRIQFVEVLKKKYDKASRLNAKEMFKHCFGIFAPNATKPSKIVLSFLPSQKPYLFSIPLHSSQTLIFENDEEIQIALNIFITYDFIKHLLSYGDEVKVIQPKKLAIQMKQIYSGALGLYNDEV